LSSFSAPFDVRISLPLQQQTDDKIDTVVQPDISVICDPNKLDAQGCIGAPDWIIEILSPATSKKDLTDKFELYQSAGVQEYWIVHPTDATVLPYKLDKDGKYVAFRTPAPFGINESIVSGVFPELKIDLTEVFDG